MSSRTIMDLPAPAPERRLAYGVGAQQFGELRLPPGDGPHPVVVVVHGGFWRARRDLTYIGHLGAALTAQGAATWSIEYARVGQEGGGWPGTFLDAARAIDHLRELAPIHHLDLTRIVAIGHSAGGHLAFWLAARPRIPAGDPLFTATPLVPRGVVALGGVVDLAAGHTLHLGDEGDVVERFMGGTPATHPARYATGSPLELLPLEVPQVLVHGTEDRDVPFVIARQYQARATACGDGARLVPLEGMGHFEPVDPGSAAWPVVWDEVRALLGL